MLGHVDRGTAILAAECQPLQDAQRNHDKRRPQADGFGGGGKPYAGGRNAHQRDGDKESVFPAELVSPIPKQDRAKWTKTEAHCKTGPDEQYLQRRSYGREKGLSDKGRQRAVDEEVIPFENGAGRRGRNDQLDV